MSRTVEVDSCHTGGMLGASGSKESALQETWVQSPGEGNGNHSNILAWRITWTEESSGLQSMRLQSQILLSD